MQRLASLVLTGALLALCWGCVTTNYGMHTSRLTDVNAGNWRVASDQFGAGETPAIVVEGYGGKMVTIRLFNLNSGRLVAEQSGDIRRGHVQWWWFKDLADGSYQAVLLVNGNTEGTAYFAVSREESASIQ